MTKELVEELVARRLIGKALGEELSAYAERYPDHGVPNHMADGVEELNRILPRTDRIDRAIAWIVVAIRREYEEIERGREEAAE